MSHTKMDVESSMEEMKVAIQEVGLYESGMSKDEIRARYQAISESKDAASEENESRNLFKSRQDLLDILDDKPEMKEEKGKFVAKKWCSEKKISSLNKNDATEETDVFEFSLNTESLQENSKPKSDPVLKDGDKDKNCMEDATKISFGFDDMLKPTVNTLRFIPRTLKYIPIQCTTEFLEADKHVKAKILYAYHTKMNDLKMQESRDSFFAAPLPPLIMLNEHHNFDSSEMKKTLEKTYTSRSGRQTKRKVYYENEDSSDGMSNLKKTKNDEIEWKGKKIDKSKIDPKMFITKQEDENANQGEASEEETNSKKKVVSENKPSNMGRPRQKKLTNAEIIKTSSLFADSPPRPSRNDLIFDRLKEQDIERKKHEKTIRLFEQSIATSGEETEEDDEMKAESKIKPVENSGATPKRIVPPIPGRKPISRRKNKKNDAETTSPGPPKNSTSPISDAESASSSKPLRKKPNLGRSLSEIRAENVASTSNDHNSSLPSNSVECPVCGHYFSESKIQEHAWTCSEVQIATSSFPRSSRKEPPTRITCELCDMVVPLSVDYDVHLRECRRKQ